MTKGTTSRQEIFAGLRHRALGKTRLARRGDALLATGIGPTPAEGLRVELGSIQGFIPELEIPAAGLRPGARLVSRTWGRVDGQADQMTASLAFEAAEVGMRLTPDFSPLGARTYELQLFHGGNLVYRQAGMSGVAGTVLDFAARPRRACCRVILYSLSFGVSATFRLQNGQEMLVDDAYFVRENPSKRLDFLTAVTYEANAVPEVLIHGEEVSVFDPFTGHEALGATQLEIQNRRFQLRPDGEWRSGVHIGWKKARSFAASFELAGVPSGAAEVVATTHASFGGRPAGPAGTTRIVGEGSGVGVQFDFGALRSETQTLELRLRGKTVAWARQVKSGPIQIATSLASLRPTLSGSLTGGSESSPLSLGVSWQGGARVSLPGSPGVVGDELIAIPDAAKVANRGAFLDSLEVRAEGLRSVVLVGECLQRVTPAGPAASLP